MNYREKKEVADKKWKKFIKVILCIVSVLLAGLLIFSAFVPPNTWKYYVKLPSVSQRKAGELRIHFLDVGQGDATLIELPDGKTLLLDGGGESTGAGKTILRYLNALDIDTIDYLVVSHADSDHCGGLIEVVKNKKIRKAYIPPTDPMANAQYATLYTTLGKEGCEIIFSSMKERLLPTDPEYPYTLAFLYPYSQDIVDGSLKDADNNDVSCVVWLDYGGVSALFTGDCSSSIEEELLRRDKLGAFSALDVKLNETEILKVSHHGSATATDLEFIEYLQVQTAVISCGKNNSYGHPTQEVIKNLTAVGASIFRTDTQGTLMVTIQNGRYVVDT